VRCPDADVRNLPDVRGEGDSAARAMLRGWSHSRTVCSRFIPPRSGP